MSRAAQRRDAGLVQNKKGTRTQPGDHLGIRIPGGSMTFPGTRRTALLKWVDRRVPESSRAALVADLAADERPGARQLGRELAARWGIGQDTESEGESHDDGDS
jgi:hypothetical protein